MAIVPIHQAKSSLSQLVKRAAGGVTIFIGGYGRAEAILSSAASAKPKKLLGLLEGKLTIPDGFDAPCRRKSSQPLREALMLPLEPTRTLPYRRG